jgi:hypothetical protein
VPEDGEPLILSLCFNLMVRAMLPRVKKFRMLEIQDEACEAKGKLFKQHCCEGFDEARP